MFAFRPLCPAHPSTRRPNGFTLIEVMVALAILAVIAGLAWRGIDAVVKSRDIVHQRMDRIQRLQAAVGQWEADMHQLVNTAIVPGLSFDGATLRATRQHPDGVQLVTWSLQPDGLHRWASAPVRDTQALQDLWIGSLQTRSGGTQDLRVLDGLSTLQFYYFDGSSNGWRNAQSSGDASDANGRRSTDRLPDGIRLVLQFAPGGTAEGTITRDLKLVHP